MKFEIGSFTLKHCQMNLILVHIVPVLSLLYMKLISDLISFLKNYSLYTKLIHGHKIIVTNICEWG